MAEWRNQLWFGDNLDVLQRKEFAGEPFVDLIYLDPPFNSNANYNVLFEEKSGRKSESQTIAFKDTWEWGDEAEAAMDRIMTGSRAPQKLKDLTGSLSKFLSKDNTASKTPMMAYIVMMAERLVELYRVLRPTGSLYLHCDPTASHYLKLVLDAIFGGRNFRSEISWKRTSAHSDGAQGRKQHGNVRDVLLFYTKTNTWTWNSLFTPYSEEYLQSAYRLRDADGRRYRRDNLTAAKPGGDVSYLWPVKRRIGGKWEADLGDEFLSPKVGWEYKQVPPYRGRFWAYSKENMRIFAGENRLAYAESGMPEYKRYLDDMPGVPLQNAWHDIPPALGKEMLGYPTQKPESLLERIIQASSNEGDVVLDPFCGCGTTIAVADRLKRRWIGIDVTYLAIGLVERRLLDQHTPEGRPKISVYPPNQRRKILEMFWRNPKDERLSHERAWLPPDLAPYEVNGVPNDLGSATVFAERDRYQFEWWAVEMVGAAGKENNKKGADKGIDGAITFRSSLTEQKYEHILVSVKSGKVGRETVTTIKSDIERDKAVIGVLITLKPSTKAMRDEATAAGYYQDPFNPAIRYPKLQILTVQDLFDGKHVDYPRSHDATFKKAARTKPIPHQGAMPYLTDSD